MILSNSSYVFGLQLTYARSGIFTGLIGRARQWAPSHFRLPGTMTASEVKDLARWLTEDGHFKYGGIDAEVTFY